MLKPESNSGNDSGVAGSKNVKRREICLLKELSRFEQARRSGTLQALKTSDRQLSKIVRYPEHTRDRLRRGSQRPVRLGLSVAVEQPQCEEPPRLAGDALQGVVALVDVCSEPRALVLCNALEELGAVVMHVGSAMITHIIWSQVNCCNGRPQGTKPCSLLSPLNVEVCPPYHVKRARRSVRPATRPAEAPAPPTAAMQAQWPAANTLLGYLKGVEQKRWRHTKRLASMTEPREGRVPNFKMLINLENYYHDLANKTVTRKDFVGIEIKFK